MVDNTIIQDSGKDKMLADMVKTLSEMDVFFVRIFNTYYKEGV